MPYKEYDTEKLVNALISDNYKMFVARNTRLVFDDPRTVTSRSAFIYVSEKFLIT